MKKTIPILIVFALEDVLAINASSFTRTKGGI